MRITIEPYRNEKVGFEGWAVYLHAPGMPTMQHLLYYSVQEAKDAEPEGVVVNRLTPRTRELDQTEGVMLGTPEL